MRERRAARLAPTARQIHHLISLSIIGRKMLPPYVIQMALGHAGAQLLPAYAEDVTSQNYSMTLTEHIGSVWVPQSPPSPNTLRGVGIGAKTDLRGDSVPRRRFHALRNVTKLAEIAGSQRIPASRARVWNRQVGNDFRCYTPTGCVPGQRLPIWTDARSGSVGRMRIWHPTAANPDRPTVDPADWPIGRRHAW